MALTATEVGNESKVLLMIRQILFQRRQDAAHLTRIGRHVYALIMHSGNHVAPLGTMEYFLYEAISNIIGWPCATIPAGNGSAFLDLSPDQNLSISAPF